MYVVIRGNRIIIKCLVGVCFLVTGAALCLSPGIVGSEGSPSQVWVATYDGPAGENDYAVAVAVDTSENVYVTGRSVGLGADFDYATVKYDSGGNQLWVARYDGLAFSDDEAQALAVDSMQNVHVTGISGGIGTDRDFATVKYDSDGNELWVARYDGPASNDDRAHAIAVDDLGNVYVTGHSRNEAGNDYDYATVKYDSEGNQLWAARYDGPAGTYDNPHAVAVDGARNVYVTGRSSGIDSDLDYATVKYDSDGNQLWIARYDGPAGSIDFPYDMAVDGLGNVYVTGRSEGNGTESDFATVKYDAGGNQLWVARYDSSVSFDDKAEALVLDGSGNVYVAGRVSYDSSGGNTDFATVKYDSEGNQVWVATYDGPVTQYDNDRATAVTLDDSGNVYVTGRSNGVGSGRDWATVKYDGDGNELWVVRYDSAASSDDYPEAIALDGSGRVYVSGWSDNASGTSDYATVKYSQGSGPTPTPTPVSTPTPTLIPTPTPTPTPTPAQGPMEVWVSRNYCSGCPNSGHTWQYDAFDAIQDGIDAVASPGTVNVAPGTYRENVALKSGVAVLGAGAGDDPSIHSIIDGGRSGTVVTAVNVDATAELQGFSIINGYGDYGGGIYNAGSSLLIADCILRGNWATNGGGGIHNYYSSPAIIACRFEQNLTIGEGSSSSGGGVFNQYSSPLIANCVFEYNSTTHMGGGVYNEDGSAPLIFGCTFVGNTASTRGGGLCNYQTSSVVVGCVFSDNEADEGGGIADYGNTVTLIAGCSFESNSATSRGGGILVAGTYLDKSAVEVTNCFFADNVAGSGGGMAHENSQAVVVNCVLIANVAVQRGGGMYVINYSSPLIDNCTFLDNTASEGAGIHTFSYSTTTVTNSILWGSSTDQVQSDFYGTSDVTYCDVRGGHGQADDHNIDLDPLFVDAASWDIHLQPSSPCIDAGDNAAVPDGLMFDFESGPRITDGDENGMAVVDIGADETDGVPAAYYDLTTASTMGGSVSAPGEPGPFTYVEGRDVSLVAAQEPGYRFHEWTGDVVTVADVLSASTTISMNGDCTATAVFAISEAWVDDDYAQGGHNDGHTWGFDAFNSIQDAIDALPTPGTVQVAAGTYYEHIILKDGLAVLGAGAGDDPTVHSIIDGGGQATVVEGVEVGSSTRIDGFTITNGSCGMYLRDSHPYVANCIFKSNSALNYFGGAMRLSSSSPMIVNCVFEANSATGYDGLGGALYCAGSPTLINCIFVGNSVANRQGGAIYIAPYSSPTIVNCSFVGNSAGNGGAIATSSATAHPELVNCILWGNTPDEIWDLEGSLVVTYSDVQGGYAGKGNIDSDPLFANPLLGDLRLGASSPCIDAGDNAAVPPEVTTDLEGNSRYADDPALPDTGSGAPPIVDMGAFEYGSFPPPTPTPTPEPLGYRDIPLVEGWNLLGLPLVLADTSIGAVLADIIDNVVSVWAYDGATESWFVYTPSPAADSLTEMIDCKGYWIDMAQADTLTVWGTPALTYQAASAGAEPTPTPPPAPASLGYRDIPLVEGWNLLGLPLVLADTSIGAVLADIIDNVVSVWAYDGATESWFVYTPSPAADSLTEMIDCKGYWIDMAQADTLTVWGTPGLVTVAPLQVDGR